MNNDFLAGILSGKTGPVPALQTGKKQSSSETGDFMSLLQNRLAFDADSFSGSTKLTTNFSFRANSGKGDLNPLLISSSETRFLSEEKPVVNSKSETYQENNARSENTASKKTDEYNRKDTEASDNARNADKSNEIEEETASADASESGKIAQTEADAEEKVSVENADLQTIENLLASFSPEEQTALINALQQMSPEDLQALAESPEDFQNNLLELIQSMPASEEQSNLLELVSRPEFLNLLSEISNELQAGLAAETLSENEAMQASEDAAEQQLSASAEEHLVKIDGQDEDSEKVASSELNENVSEAATQGILSGHAHAQNAESKAAAAEAVVNLNMNNSEATNSTVDQTSAVAAEKSSDKESETATPDKDAKNQEKSSVEDGKENSGKTAENSANQVNRESLRQEFKRLNDTQNVTEASIDGTTTTDAGETSTGNTQNHAATSPTGATAEVKPAIEEAARRFLTLLGEKASGSNGKSEGHVFSAVSAENGKKTVHATGSSNNSSMNNGYSFQSGSTANANAAARTASSVPVTSAAFAELLDKAEFVKMKNGSKVLNIELDPKELGKVEMELTSKDGAVTARISAENTMAKAKLDELAPQIKEQLVNQGVNLTEITVDISSRDPDERNGNQMSGGKGKSSRITASKNDDAEAIIRKNILPNLRRAALNIQAVDMTV